MGKYTLRRTYLLNRYAWILILFDIAFAIFGGQHRSWTIIIGIACLAFLFWAIAGSIERKRKNKLAQSLDESGNAKPKRL